MKTRIFSAFILVPLAMVVFIGGIPLAFVAFTIGAMAISEFIDGFAKAGIKLSKLLAWSSLFLLYVIYAMMLLSDMPFETFSQYILLWFFASIATGLILVIFTKDHNPATGTLTVGAVFYIGFFSSYIVLFDVLPQGSNLVWLTLLTSFGTDICAYFSGMLLGKRKLCVALSPKKTVEGAIGGVVGSVLLSILFAQIFAPELILHCTVIGVLGSVFAQFGDLVASAFKRKMGVKDYGNLIPGHGGILDRFDSILFTIPLIYYYVTLVIYPH
ncbi:MAG: phosphatidate cytidylyltransferase [Clostridia bacterium]|nr:phosphatidate cytidylyltransferase [Clostridia bacterium]